MKLINYFLSKSNSYSFYKSNYESLKKRDYSNRKKISKFSNEIEMLQIENNNLTKENKKIVAENNRLTQENEILIEQKDRLDTIISDIKISDEYNKKINEELKYAFVFNDTIKQSSWLKNKDFSLINAAANYSFIYLLYKIINDTQPKNILEMGLGQTSKLTTQYVDYFEDTMLYILEGDSDWIETFSQKLNLDGNVEIFDMDLEEFEYNGTNNIRFKDVSNVVADNKFDLIIIDGPQGFICKDNKNINLEYSRTNIWELIPNNLNDDFIIVIDDYERNGEKNTMHRVEELLKDNDINYYTYSCNGLKTQYAIFSEKYKFIQWI